MLLPPWPIWCNERQNAGEPHPSYSIGINNADISWTDFTWHITTIPSRGELIHINPGNFFRWRPTADCHSLRVCKSAPFLHYRVRMIFLSFHYYSLHCKCQELPPRFRIKVQLRSLSPRPGSGCQHPTWFGRNGCLRSCVRATRVHVLEISFLFSRQLHV